MKEIGMPYSALMILAKLAGRKNQSRRVVVPQPPDDTLSVYKDPTLGYHFIRKGNIIWPGPTKDLACSGKKPPRGIIGDCQYWQEAFDFGTLHELCGAYWIRIRYKADKLQRDVSLTPREAALIDTWKQPKPTAWRGMPAMFMLRSMSRGLDEITGLRVERVQDISEEDAIAEGLDGTHPNGGIAWSSDQGRTWKSRPTLAYAQLWDSINGKRYPWESNPYVWIYETREIKPSK